MHEAADRTTGLCVRVLPCGATPSSPNAEVSTQMAISDALRDQLTTVIQKHRVVLFMKGERHAPGCGFSASVVGTLDTLLPEYETVNVLADAALRDGIKEFSSWPTIPQLYIDGQFIGGADIVRDLHGSGELHKLLGVTASQAPTVTVSEAAATAFLDAAKDAAGDVLHLEVGARGEYDLYFGPATEGAVRTESRGVVFHLDPASARRADGLTIDFVRGANGEGGFKISNPSTASVTPVRGLSTTELKAMKDRGEKFELFDVRTDAERKIAVIAGARHLDREGETYLQGLDRATPVVFHCHHGVRSMAAAEHYAREGFRTVYNLQGGIDAWSLSVDPGVPRY